MVKGKVKGWYGYEITNTDFSANNQASLLAKAVTAAAVKEVLTQKARALAGDVPGEKKLPPNVNKGGVAPKGKSVVPTKLATGGSNPKTQSPRSIPISIISKAKTISVR